MTQEELNYSSNHNIFLARLKDAFVEKIIFALDKEPAFNIASIPFCFYYSFSAAFVTNIGIFRIQTSMTSNGAETFWIEEVPKEVEGKVLEVNSSITSINFEAAIDGSYPYKIAIHFPNRELFLYCGEIYDDYQKLKYTIHDEMILAFESRSEAMTFESLLDMGGNISSHS